MPHSLRILESAASLSGKSAFIEEILPSKRTFKASGAATAEIAKTKIKKARGLLNCGLRIRFDTLSSSAALTLPPPAETAKAGSAHRENTADAKTPTNPNAPSCTIPPPRHPTMTNAIKVVEHITNIGAASFPATPAAKRMSNLPFKSSGQSTCTA